MAGRGAKNQPANRAGSESAGPALAERLVGWAPLLIAVVATLAVWASVSPLTEWGPGVTCDEIYDVACGKHLVWGLERYGLSLFTPPRIEEVFGSQAQHPPLGRWALGTTQRLFDSQPDDLDVLSVVAARFAPGLAFGVNIWLVGVCARRHAGLGAGLAASLALALMPRAFGHAHLASLDTLTNLSCTAATMGLGWAVTRGADYRSVALAGLLWGLALLTKIQGALLFVPLSAWMIWQLGPRALTRWPLWASMGVATFFVGWPWLWLDPLGNLRLYLGTAVDRLALHTFYFGRVWNDVDTPWHYPWLMTLATVPLGFLLLAGWGIVARARDARRDPWVSLPLVALAFWLLVFSWPGVPVYDGVRLFLPAFSQLALCVGWGFAEAWRRATERWPQRPQARAAVAGGFLVCQGVGLLLYLPFHLSYYNLVVGGLPGAQRLGFEVTYWGDTVNGPLLSQAAQAAAEQAAPGDAAPPRILFAPHLAPYQSSGLMLSYPELLDLQATVIGWDPQHPETAEGARTIVVYHRRADWPQVEPLLAGAKLVAENQRQGVWLSRVYRIKPPPARPATTPP